MHIGSVGVFLLLSSQRLDLCKLSRRASFGIWDDLSLIHSAGERFFDILGSLISVQSAGGQASFNLLGGSIW